MIGTINYGAGNIRSVANALDGLQKNYFVSRDIAELQRAEKLILPGVGEARSAMDSLNRVGLLEWLTTVTVPFLGICIGMQILFEHSAERDTDCLGVVSGHITKFNEKNVRVPHIGWNKVSVTENGPLFRGLRNDEFFYFVHSFRAPVVKDTIGISDYDGQFAAAVQHRNFYGVQFHAEKSGTAGIQILKNFIELC